jgi:Tfp pilus assembly protein PilO
MMQQKIRTGILVPVCLVLAFLLYFKAFLGPVQEDIRVTGRELSSLQESMASTRGKARELDDLTVRLSDLESQLQEKKTSLPDTLDSHDLVLLVSKIDPGMLVKNSLIFLEPVEREDFVILPVRFHFSTNYTGLTDLLAYLDSLATRPSVSNMQISASGQQENIRNSMEEAGKVIYNLDVEMTLNFYAERN